MELLASLLGVLVGGLISALTARSLEGARWRRERQEKLATQRREALAGALGWIQPMRNAQVQASGLLASAIHGDAEPDRVRAEWPTLLSQLALKDLPGHHIAVLPSDVYRRGHRIVFELDQIRGLAVGYAEEAQRRGRAEHGLAEGYPRLEAVEQAIAELEDILQKTYRATFES